MTLSDLISGGPTGQQGLGGIVNRFIAPTNALGQFGKALTQASGGAVGDALSLLDHQKRQGEQDAMQQQLQQAQLAAMTAKQNRGQFIQLPNGGVAFGNPDDGSFNMIRDGETPRSTEPAAVQIARAAGLQEGTPEWTKALTLAIPGYGYSDSVLDRKRNDQLSLIGARTAGSLTVKRTPTYAQTHPAATGAGGGGSSMSGVSTADLLAALRK